MKSKEKLKFYLLLVISVTILSFNSGCTITTRTIFIPPSTPVILREDIEKVKVWILDPKTKAYYAAEKTIYRGQHVLSYDIKKGVADE